MRLDGAPARLHGILCLFRAFDAYAFLVGLFLVGETQFAFMLHVCTSCGFVVIIRYNSVSLGKRSTKSWKWMELSK